MGRKINTNDGKSFAVGGRAEMELYTANGKMLPIELDAVVTGYTDHPNYINQQIGRIFQHAFTDRHRVDRLHVGVHSRQKLYEGQHDSLTMQYGGTVYKDGNFGGEGLQNWWHQYAASYDVR